MSGPGYPRRVPSQLSDSSSRRKRAGAPSVALGEMRNPTNRRGLAAFVSVSVLRRQTQDISRPTLRMHFEHFRCEMPGFCNPTPCLHQASKLTAGRASGKSLNLSLAVGLTSTPPAR